MHKLLLFCLTLFALAGLTRAQEQPQGPLSVEAFVTASYIHGVPFDLSSRFTKEDIPALITMLNDDEMKPFWSNIIWVLGAIPDDRSFEEIRNFMHRRFNGEVDSPTFHALIQCSPAIGAIAHQNENAFRYLQQAAFENFWKESEIPWSFRTLKRTNDREILLTQLAINGLGISGREQAMAILQNLQNQLESDASLRFYTHNIAEGIVNAKRVMDGGLQSILPNSGAR